jgi:hypothetical protein
MLYDRTNKPYLTEHSGHCSCWADLPLRGASLC